MELGGRPSRKKALFPWGLEFFRAAAPDLKCIHRLPGVSDGLKVPRQNAKESPKKEEANAHTGSFFSQNPFDTGFLRGELNFWPHVGKDVDWFIVKEVTC